MRNSCHVNLCVLQPAGYVHSLGLLDAALFVEFQLKRLGVRTQVSKNRLTHGAINLIFGAHLGFDADLTRDYTCVIVNLEQIGQGGAHLNAAYRQLLAQSLVIDYDIGNVLACGKAPDDVPLIQFGFAPYLKAAPSTPQDLASRPIDLLFFGSLNARRNALLERIKLTGRAVSVVNTAVYGPERDDIIRSAKAVLNLHHYDTARFEQVRAFLCLSLGTPFVSERTASTNPAEAFDLCSIWFGDANLESFFAEEFLSPSYFEVGSRALEVFRDADPLGVYADAFAFMDGVHRVCLGQRQSGATPTRKPVTRLHIGSGKDYKPGWFNVDIQASTRPDAILDLGQAVSLPLDIDSEQSGPVRLTAGTVKQIYANNVLEHVPDLSTLMSNCLALLETGGQMTIEVPHERAPGAWQDPTHVRAMNDRSWLYYTDWFWYLGWFEHRFETARFEYLDHRLQVCERDAAWFMRVTLRKIETSITERVHARTARADFGPGYSTDCPESVCVLKANNGWPVPAGLPTTHLPTTHSPTTRMPSLPQDRLLAET